MIIAVNHLDALILNKIFARPSRFDVGDFISYHCSDLGVN